MYSHHKNVSNNDYNGNFCDIPIRALYLQQITPNVRILWDDIFCVFSKFNSYMINRWVLQSGNISNNMVKLKLY